MELNFCGICKSYALAQSDRWQSGFGLCCVVQRNLFQINVWDRDYGSVFVAINATLKTMSGSLIDRATFVYKGFFSVRIPLSARNK